MTYSFPKNLYSPVLWPFTMDFGYTLVCNIARCPKRSYPGLWVVPVVVVMDYRSVTVAAVAYIVLVDLVYFNHL